MNKDELLDELTEDVLAYVMHGEFPERHFVKEIRPSGLDDRFTDWEMLVRLHFVLKPEVVLFVETLPERLRELKTQTEKVSESLRGQIEGRINWSKTFRERYARSPRNPALFVCDDRSESYDIDENVVVKHLLSVIYSTLRDCQEYLRADYDWVSDRWRENLELIDMLTEIVERNVHVRRIREPESYEPTERMLVVAEQARGAIYRDAACLLRNYRSSLAGESEAIRLLLETTAITPDDEETLFELFVLFKYIGAIESLGDEEFEIRTIRSEKQEIARLHDSSNDTEIVLYHDNSARRRGLSFDSSPESEELSRHETVHQESTRTARQYFKNEALGSTTGRPDVIVLEVERGETSEYLITEVKHSSNRQTVREGIQETLEYLAFLRKDGRFVFDESTDFLGTGWNGVLVVQDIADCETASLEEQDGQSIRILQAREVTNRLSDILSEAL